MAGAILGKGGNRIKQVQIETGKTNMKPFNDNSHILSKQHKFIL